MNRRDAARGLQPGVSAALYVLLAAAAALAIAARLAAGGHFVYALDDAYIQMALAKNLARHGVWGVTADAFSGAGSSLLWPPLLAAVDRAAGFDERAPFVLNLFAACALLALAQRVLRRYVASAGRQTATLTLMVVAVPLPVLAIVGMEHTLQCVAALALAAACVRACAAGDAAERGRWMRATLAAAAVAVAVRYDSGSVVAAVIVLFASARQWRASLLVATFAAAPAAVYALVARAHGWPLVPSSILLKQRLADVHPFTWHGAADAFGGGALMALAQAPALAALLLAALAQVVVMRDACGEHAHEQRLWLAVFAIATLVHVQFGRLGWLYRYEAYLVALGIVANASALGDRALSVAPAAACAVVVSLLGWRGVTAAREAVADVGDLYRHEYQMAQFFARRPASGALMLGDIGLITYFSDTPIVDTGGLATRELLEQARRKPYDWDLVEQVARAHDVRVSMSGNPGVGARSWVCVAEWRARDERRADRTFLYASDRDAASALDRDLRAFAAADRDRVTAIVFADAISCPGPRQ